MKDLSKLFALIMMLSAALTFTACSDDDPDPVPEEEDPTAAALVGDWVMNPEAGALAVGPAEGSAEWWFIPEADVATRACYFNDVYTFGADGSFSQTLGDQTWLETWQGVDEGCGSPVTPHNGSGSFNFGATETSITLEGVGAFIGLSKVINGSELAEGSTVPTTRTYKILEFNPDSTPKTLKLDVEVADGGHWTFNLISQ